MEKFREHKIGTEEKTKQLVITAMFFAIGIVLPFFFGQIPQIGSMLLPMHIPVFLCALICGWQYGVPMAFLLPLMRSVLFGRPNLYPEAIAIAFEMATYAFVAGFLYNRSKWKCTRALYHYLIIAMILGRVVRTIIQLSLLGISGTDFSFGTFFMGVMVAGIPGIILQMFVIPAVMLMFQKTDFPAYIQRRNEGKQGDNMVDLMNAKKVLFTGDFTCVLCKENHQYTSTYRGVKPLVKWYEEKTDFTEYSAADKVVGKATAFLYALFGVKAVYAGVISHSALQVLQQNDIYAEYGVLVENIINRKGDGICPFEEAVLAIDNKTEAYEVIVQKMKELSYCSL